MLTILCGYSAVGKDTYQNYLLERNPDLERLVSYTTRPMRLGEVDGVEYHFIHESDFRKLESMNFFIETRTYETIQDGRITKWHYGLSYGAIKNSKNAITVIDHQGTRDILSYAAQNNLEVKVVYLKASDLVLKNRSMRRNDEEQEFDRRLKDDKIKFEGIDEIANLTLNTHQDDHTKNLLAIEALMRGGGE